VFREFASRPGIDLLLVYATREEVPNVEPSGFPAIHEPDWRRWIGPRPLMWNRAQIRYAHPDLADVLFLSWDLHYLSLLPALLRARANGTATVLWGHGYSKNESPWRRRARAEVGNLATALLFYNRATAALYVDDGVDPRRVFVAPNALDQSPIRQERAFWGDRPDALAEFRREQGLDGPLILFVSRLEGQNRVDLLLSAAARLRHRHPRLKVVIIGKGEEEPLLRQRTADLKLSDAVRFLGSVYDESQLAPWFVAADVFCYPANIGLSLLHSFGYGLPVVTSDRTEAQNPEIEALRPGENGLTFRDGDVADLTAKLDHLLSDDPLRRRLCQGALRTISERFSIEKMVDGMEAAARYCVGYSPPLHVERRQRPRVVEAEEPSAPAAAQGPLKLAIVSNSITPYRVHVHQRIARELPEVNLFSVITHGTTNAAWTLDVPPEINVVMFGHGESSDRQDQLAAAPQEWRKGGRIIRWLAENDVRVVVVQGYNDLGRLRIIRWCRRKGVPCFLSGDSNILGDRATGVRKWVKRQVLPRVIRQCTGVMAAGSRGEAYFAKYGAAPRDIFLFPYEPDYGLIQDVSRHVIETLGRRFDLKPERRRILFAGRMINEKRPDLALDAFVRIAEQRPDWDLILMGDGVLRGRLEGSVPDRVTSRVTWTGFIARQEEVSALYRLCDVLVLPSEYEPWAVVVNEAAAAGLAIVCSNVVGAAAELVRDGVNGWTFPPGDLETLVVRLLDVTDARNIDRMKSASKPILAEWERAGDPVRNLWKAVASARGGKASD
jgi:glycosyltransferase involved in cell wall biosynthesis